MEKDKELMLNRLREYNVDSWDEALTALLRVKLVQKDVAASKMQENLFQVMKRVTEREMGYFKGDEQLFNNLYTLLVDVDIFDFITIVAKKHERENTGGFQVPRSLYQLFNDKLEASSCQTVLLPEAEHIQTGIADLAQKYPAKQFTVPTMNDTMFQLQSLAYEGYENVEVIRANIYDADFTDKKYDFIFSFPAFNAMFISNKGTFIDSKSDLIAAENLLRVLSFDGQMMILLPARITFGGGSVAKLRSFIEHNYKIDAISAMPKELLLPFTAIRTYLMEFSRGHTNNIEIKAYESTQKGIKDGAQDMSLSNHRTISKKELDGLGNWNVELLWAEKDAAMEQYQDSAVQKVRLSEVAEIFRGKAVKDKSENGNIALLNISNVVGVRIDYTDLDYFEDEERNVMKYALKTGDVLFTNRGTAIRAGVFEEQDKICIPSANLTVIRPKDVLNGKYLSIFIESPIGQRLLRSIQRGATILNINHHDLCELVIPLPPLEVQARIVAEYEKEAKRYREVTTEAQTRWDTRREKLYKELY